MARAFIPYGIYWSTPFAKWQGSLAHLHSLKLAANVGKQFLQSKKFPLEQIDLGVLGITNPQPSSFYGLPWVTGMMGLEGVALRASDIDVVYTSGYGFPRYRGGPMFYADTVGLKTIYERILEFGRTLDARYWKPAPLLEELALAGSSFAAWQAGRKA